MPDMSRGFNRAWADAEVIAGRLLTTDETVQTVAEEYGCSAGTIINIYRATAPADQRRAAYLRKQRSSCAARRGVPTGRVPVHAFKRGTLNGNSAAVVVPVGTIVIRRAGRRGKQYRWIKVTEIIGAGGKNWKALATVLWEKREGRAVPPGHTVVHDDGDTLNDEPSNLILVTTAGRLTRNMSPAARERWRIGAGRAASERARLRREARAIRQQNEASLILAEAGPGACPVPAEHKASTDVPRAAKDVARERVAAFLSQLDYAEAA